MPDQVLSLEGAQAGECEVAVVPCRAVGAVPCEAEEGVAACVGEVAVGWVLMEEGAFHPDQLAVWGQAVASSN